MTRFLTPEGILQLPIPDMATDDAGSGNFPTIDDLNRPDANLMGREGIKEGGADHFDKEQSAKNLHDRRISRLIEIDVREFPLEPEP